MDLKKLAEPFPASDIEWRVQQAGAQAEKPWALVLAYVTNRAIMQRLDDVCGIENWRNEYQSAPDGGVMCGISVRVWVDKGQPGNFQEWVTKWDGAENTNVEAVKGGLSNAMKRAAVQWGMGRYLYKLEASFVSLSKTKIEGGNRHYDKDTKSTYYWNSPALPVWALPEKVERQAAEDNQAKTLNAEQVAKLISLAKHKGAETKEEAIKFINGALLTKDFTKLEQSEFDGAKAVLSDPKVTYSTVQVDPF